MTFLTDNEINALRIDKFIFHVVQHEAEEPILLDETPIEGFEDFFLERVKDTLKGNHFTFNPGSATLLLLNEVVDDPNKFVPISKQLAINFHAARSKTIKAGAIIFIRLFAANKELYSLIKYDREQVLSYSVKDSRAVLEEIVNSFTKSKGALQKSALIELKEEGGELVVIDRTVSYDITDFFKGFLNIKKIYSDADMTKIVHDCAVQTVIKYFRELPSDITENTRSVAFQSIQEMTSFDQEEYFNAVFGAYGTPKIKRTFDSLLKRNNIEGDTFKFVKDAIKPPKTSKLRTKEGVRISYGEIAKKTVKIERGKTTTITIKTEQLYEE